MKFSCKVTAMRRCCSKSRAAWSACEVAPATLSAKAISLQEKWCGPCRSDTRRSATPGNWRQLRLLAPPRAGDSRPRPAPVLSILLFDERPEVPSLGDACVGNPDVLDAGLLRDEANQHGALVDTRA